MLKRLIVVLATIASTGCVTVVLPPTTTPTPEAPVPQIKNELKQRVDVDVTSDCNPKLPLYLDLVYQDKPRARLACGQSFTIYVQRGITTGERCGTVLAKAYDTDNHYLWVALLRVPYPTNSEDSWRVQKVPWTVTGPGDFTALGGYCQQGW